MLPHPLSLNIFGLLMFKSAHADEHNYTQYQCMSYHLMYANFKPPDLPYNNELNPEYNIFRRIISNLVI